MKYAFMSFSAPAADLAELLRLARSFGYDGIEPRCAADHRHGIELGLGGSKASELRRMCADEGIEISCVATSCSFADPDKAAVQVESARAFIELAALVGARRLRVFGGAIPEGCERTRSFDSVVSSLRALAPTARASGVDVCVETHDSWCDAREVKRVMEAVADERIRVNWDIMHPVLTAGQSMAEAFGLLSPWISHVHIHDGTRDDGTLRFLPIGTGKVDHLSAVRLLKKTNYAGYLSGEWIGWEAPELHLGRELGTMKKYEEEAGK